MTLCVVTLLPAAAAQPRQVLDTVTVTARKQEQRAFDVPLSLSVLQGEGLDRLRASGMDIRFLTNRTPSLQVMSGFGRIYPYFFIRGLGNTDFDMNASQPVSVMHDGIVLENPWLKGHPIFDVERVEVLRGPQGTLFGRNTPAGIVKIESARPTWDVEGYARLSYGRFDSVNFEGALSGPLIPSVLAARASLLVQRRSDWVDNTYTGKDDAVGRYDDIAGRVQFLWTPVENFSGRFKVHVRDFDGNARLFRANALKPGRTGLRPGLRRDKVAQDADNPQDLASHGFATELRYTPDDVGALKDDEKNLKPRARQNVVFELGYFLGRLGRERVCALTKGNVEIPSDYDGVVYISLDDGGWKIDLIRELKNVGFGVDANKAL